MKGCTVLKYRAPIVGWVFMVFWFAILLLVTYLFIREGGFHQFSYELEMGFLALFYAFGLGGAAHFFSFPIVDVINENNQIKIKKFWPFKNQTEFFEYDTIEFGIVKEISSEGDHYSCVIRVKDKEDLVIASSSDQGEATRIIENLKQAFTRS